MRLNSKTPRGVTLVELILAMLLLSVVVLTGVSMEMGLRRLFFVSDVESELMGEAAGILTFVSKRINTAPGNLQNTPVDNLTVAGQYIRYRVRRDTNMDGVLEPTDGADEFYYCMNWGGLVDELWYGRNGAPVVMLSDKVVFFRIGNATGEGCDGCSFVTLTLRRDPSRPVNATNPEITLNTTAQYRGMSIR